MPEKNAITVTELVLLLIVWSACQTAWRVVVVEGLSQGVRAAAPGLGRLAQNAIVGAILLAAVYAFVLLAANVTVGRTKVWQLTD